MQHILPHLSERMAVLGLVFALGLLSMTTQLLVLRECTAVFGGNELVLGMVLAMWLLLSALGTALGGRMSAWLQSVRAFGLALCVLAMIPPMQVLSLRTFRLIAGVGGAELEPAMVALVLVVVLAPYCIPAGLLLVVATRLVQPGRPAVAAGNVYGMDTFGAVIGGGVFGFVLVWMFDHMAAAAVVGLWVVGMVLVLLVCRALAMRALRAPGPGSGKTFWLSALLGLIPALGLVSVLVLKLDLVSTRAQLGPQQLLFKTNSAYGRVILAAAGGQTNIIENGLVIASVPDITRAEELVHFAMLQHPAPKTVLLVSGLAGYAIPELLKYDLDRIDCVELDPALATMFARFFPAVSANPRVRIVLDDARRYLIRTANRYDVVILNTPDPVTLQLNRLYTAEFLELVKLRLAPGGVMLIPLGSYRNYIGPDLARLLRCAMYTLRCVFASVLAVPGSSVFFVASDRPVTVTNLMSGLEERQIRTLLLGRSYFEAILAPDRIAELERALVGPAPLNTDFHPRLYLMKLTHWLGQFSLALPVALGCAGVIALGMALAWGRVATAVFVSGFAGSAIEIVMLLVIQVVSGALYQHVASIITVFMAGLGTGAWLGSNRLARDFVGGLAPGRAELWLCGLSLVLSVLGLGVWIGLPVMRTASAAICLVWIWVFTGVAGFVAGAQFPVANAAEVARTGEDSRATARIFTADFIGGFLGMLLPPLVLVPLLGVGVTCLTVAVVSVLAAMWLFVGARRARR